MKKRIVKVSLDRAKKKTKELAMKNPTLFLQEIKEKDIDYSDAPELSNEQLSKFRKPGRPVVGVKKRVPISVKIDEHYKKPFDVIAKRIGESKNNLINKFYKQFVFENLDQLTNKELNVFKLKVVKKKKAA